MFLAVSTGCIIAHKDKPVEMQIIWNKNQTTTLLNVKKQK